MGDPVSVLNSLLCGKVQGNYAHFRENSAIEPIFTSILPWVYG